MPRLWRLRLICCGKDNGSQIFKTWEDAEDFRLSWTTGPGVAKEPDEIGHDRSAIIEEAEGEG